MSPDPKNLPYESKTLDETRNLIRFSKLPGRAVINLVRLQNILPETENSCLKEKFFKKLRSISAKTQKTGWI